MINPEIIKIASDTSNYGIKENSNLVSKICHFELDEINKTFEKQLSIKSLLKKAQLPKLAKAIS